MQPPVGVRGVPRVPPVHIAHAAHSATAASGGIWCTRKLAVNRAGQHVRAVLRYQHWWPRLLRGVRRGSERRRERRATAGTHGPASDGTTAIRDTITVISRDSGR